MKLNVLGIALIFVMLTPKADAMVVFAATGAEEAWTVPATGIYTITAAGAQGGTGGLGGVGGLGATISASFDLIMGESLIIAVGQQGGNASGNGNLYFSIAGGGGGGGTFIAIGTGLSPLLVAGGGGGGAYNGAGGGGNLIGGYTGFGVGIGGSSSGGGAGGGGWYYPGSDATTDGLTSQGGSAFLSGAEGGAGVSASGGFGGVPGGGFVGGGDGGFGGGGGGGYATGGGGGGFYGGTLHNDGTASNGGWSYLDPAGTAISLISGDNAGDGFVQILSATDATIPEPGSIALLWAGLPLLAGLRLRKKARLSRCVTSLPLEV